MPNGRPGVTVLAYHLVGAGTDSPVDLPVEVFERQMRELHRWGCVIPLRTALRILERTEALDRDRVVVSFDDAYENFDRIARPILAALDVPATLFVPTDFVDGAGRGPLTGAEDLPPMGWDRLRDLGHDGRVELASHSRSHPDLRALGQRDLEREIRGSAEVIRARTGIEPETFCYPRGLWSSTAERVVSEVYRGAVVGGGRKNRPGSTRPTRIQRVSIRRDMPASLEPLTGAGVVLEEWIANRGRLLRRFSRPRGDGAAAGRRGDELAS